MATPDVQSSRTENSRSQGSSLGTGSAINQENRAGKGRLLGQEREASPRGTRRKLKDFYVRMIGGKAIEPHPIPMVSNRILTMPLFRRVFLPRGFYTGDNTDAQEYDRADDDPVRRHVRQVRAVNQPTDQNRKTQSVKSERHNCDTTPFAMEAEIPFMLYSV
jgi:hypothetical protein